MLKHFSIIHFSIFVIFIFVNLSTKAVANNEPSGESLYQQCAACHGIKGQGNEQLKAPQIAGQFAWYQTRQLQHFSNGIRGSHKEDVLGKQMQAITQSLNFEKDIPRLTAYIEQLTIEKGDNEDKSSFDANKLKNGSRYYQAKCGACHGGEGQGNKSFNAPKLNQLNADYLLRQMNNFTQGIRGTDKRDKFGRQMAMMAKTTKGKELNDIIYYLNSINDSQSKLL